MLIGCLATADPSVASELVVDSHLVLWLDAQDNDGNGGQGNEPGDGTPLARWADKSAYGNHAVQPVAKRRPECIKADAPFCRVRFAAPERQHLQIANRPCLDLDRLTAFVVARAHASPRAMWLFGKNRFDGPWTGYGIAVAGGSSFPWPHLRIGGAGQRLRTAVNGRRTNLAVAGPIRANDRNLLIGAGAQAIPGAQHLDGEIAELLLYNRVLKPAEQEQMRQYLVAEYGIELTVSDAPEQMVIIARPHLPVIVEDPVTPKTPTRIPEAADAVLRRDWLFPCLPSHPLTPSIAPTSNGGKGEFRASSTPSRNKKSSRPFNSAPWQLLPTS